MAKEKPVYKYKVVERTFKEGKVMLDGEAFESTEVYNSRALEAANDETAAAVAALKAEHEALRKKAAPISNAESDALRDEAKELRADLAEALGALKQAAAAKK